jgi:hypothetical protein
MAEQPATLPPATALRTALTQGLAATFGEDEEVILSWARIGYRTTSLRPRMAMQQAALGDLFLALLLERAPARGSFLRWRVTAGALAAGLFVALDVWQAADGNPDLRELIDRALTEAAEAFDRC